MIRLDRAAEVFRSYLAQVPADANAWAGLGSVELARGDFRRAALALKISILTAPWSTPLLVLRCGMAMDLFRVLDGDERELMKGQFRLAAKRSIGPLVDMARSRNGIMATRILLASSPDELISFETELGRRR
jgi:hypothetical protein